MSYSSSPSTVLRDRRLNTDPRDSEAVGKRITPKQQQQQQQQSFGSNSDRRNFCFVDFATTEDAQAALDALDGSMYREAPLRVSMARGKRND